MTDWSKFMPVQSAPRVRASKQEHHPRNKEWFAPDWELFIFFPMSVSHSKQDRKSRSYHSNMKRSGKVQYNNFSKNNCFVCIQAKIFCTALPSPDQCICNANQPSSSICITIITWKNLFNIRRLIGADEWLWHDIHGIEIQLKTASGTEVVVIVQHVPWDFFWNTAISCTGWEILWVFMAIC